jgi:hypothetical protein
MVWPPRRRDLTCDSSLWGIVKEKIFQLRLTVVEDQKTAVRHCFNDFQPSTWKVPRITWGKIKICAENGGKHTDNFTDNFN